MISRHATADITPCKNDVATSYKASKPTNRNWRWSQKYSNGIPQNVAAPKQVDTEYQIHTCTQVALCITTHHGIITILLGAVTGDQMIKDRKTISIDIDTHSDLRHIAFKKSTPKKRVSIAELLREYVKREKAKTV